MKKKSFGKHNTEYKVGDWVKLIDLKENTHYYRLRNMKLNDVFQVAGVDHEGVYVEIKDGKEAYLDNGEFELAEDYILKQLWS